MKIKFISCSIAVLFLSLSTINAQNTKLESKARAWLTNNAAKVGLSTNADLQLKSSRKSISGENLRFNMTIDGVPVYKGDIVVHFNKAEEVTFSTEIARKNISIINTKPSLSLDEAYQKAVLASPPKGEIIHQENKLFVYDNAGENILVYRVLIESHDKVGSWETIIDAVTGATISVKDIAHYFGKHKDHHSDNFIGPLNNPIDPPKKVNGTAYVFDPDPLARAGAIYGGNYVDGGDATNASLDAARSLVTLEDLEFSNNQYHLKNSYTQIAALQAPTTGLFSQTSSDFLFNRSEQGFEAVNVFWHFTNSLKYINETLGIVCKPTSNGGVVRFDPHGQSGADNSAYYGGGQYLTFGEGGVDDAEDADVVLHELGHGIHDWISDGNLSNTQGLSEGSGDYWAVSYKRGLGLWPSSAPQYNWVFGWDGHNGFWNGRVTNYTGKYPTNAGGGIHAAGQIWGTTLMRIYDRIGKEKTDRIFLEGLAMTDSSANQQTAAIAVRQAALDMLGDYGFNCEDVAIITEEMTLTGYTLPSYDCMLSVGDFAKKEIKLYPNPANEVLNINVEDSGKAVVLNAEGRIVKNLSLKSGKNTVDVSGLTKGVYIINVNGNSQKFIKK